MAQDDYYEKVQALRREQPHVSSSSKRSKTTVDADEDE
tara:strand:- start:292 stop:405 length:114 start_codon:yes stop_codon:yes gene_type:complete